MLWTGSTQWPNAFAVRSYFDVAIVISDSVIGSELALCLAALALAAFAQGVFGLGFAMIATPLLALILNYQAAIFMAAVPLLVLASYWLLINRRMVIRSGVPWTLLPGIAGGAAVGVAAQIALPQRASLLLLAALLVLSVAIPWILGRWHQVASDRMRRAAPLFGALAGITEAALNVGAPFVVLFAALSRLSRVQQMVALNLCFCVGKAIQVALLLAVAPAPVSGISLPLGVVVCLVFFRLGDHFAGRFPEDSFRQGLRFFLCVMAALLVVRASLAP
jgi:uncharacterized protein